MQNVEQFIQEARKFFYVRRTKHKRVSRSDPGQVAHGAWNKLGDGYYGEAWGHSAYAGLVLKISGPSGWGYGWRGQHRHAGLRGDGPRADVWPAFAEACILHPHMNLPEIMHLERAGGFAWGVMPRYVEQDGANYHDVVQAFRGAVHGSRAAEHWMLPLLEIARQRNVTLDLHSGNVMMHPDTYEPVIIDPFSSTGYGYTEVGSTTCDEDEEYDWTDTI
jgi:hypothetical protein